MTVTRITESSSDTLTRNIFAFTEFCKNVKSEGRLSLPRWVKPKYDVDQIRLIVFVENDIKGRILLFDSKAIRRSEEPRKSPCSTSQAAKFLCRSKLLTCPQESTIPRYKYVKAGSDVKVLEEMMFGSVAMSYKGSAMKVHSIKTPAQLMLTKVFVPEKYKVAASETDGGLDSLTTSSCDLTSPKHILRAQDTGLNIAQSVPVDVPQPKYSPLHDSGIASSATSSGSFAPTYTSSGSSSMSLSTSSLNSLHRRWLRNHSTSIEGYLRKRSSVEHGKAVATGAVHRKDKLGVGILFQVGQDKNADNTKIFQNFFFSHITIFEARVAKLEAAIERGFYSKANFIHIVMQAFDLFRREVCDLYTAPRLSEPVWLNMVSYSSYRYVLCEQFMRELMAFYKHDTKATRFFLSNVITAALTYHLAWVPTVTPVGGTPSRAYLEKHTATWLDTLTKTHPYNALWAQLGDAYGAIGHPKRLSRTIVVGKKADLVNKLLYILSYFIRCSEVNGSVHSTSTNLLSHLANMNFSTNTIVFEPVPVTPVFDYSERLSLYSGIDVASLPINSHKSSSIDTSSTVSSPRTTSGSESSSLRTVESSEISSAFSVCDEQLDKIMSRIDDLGVTNHAAASCSEVSRVVSEAIKDCDEVTRCGKSQFYTESVIPKCADIVKGVGDRCGTVKVFNRFKDRGKGENINRVYAKYDASINKDNCDMNKTLKEINKSDHQKLNVCKMLDEHGPGDVEIVNMRHLGRDVQIPLLDLPVVNSPTEGKVRSLLSEQLSASELNRSSISTVKQVHDSGYSDSTDSACLDYNHGSLKSSTSDLENQEQATPTNLLKLPKSVAMNNLLTERSTSLLDEYFDGTLETKTIDDIPEKDLVLCYRLPNQSNCSGREFSLAKRSDPGVSNEQSVRECTNCSRSEPSLAERTNNCDVSEPSVTQCSSYECSHRWCRCVKSQPTSPISPMSPTPTVASRSRSSTPTEVVHRRHISGTPSCDSEVTDPLHNCIEIHLPQLDQASPTAHRVQSFDQNLGRSLMAAFSDHYLSDFVLQGTSDPNIYAKVSTDLAASVQQPVLGEAVAEAVAVVADTDKWTVNVISSHVASEPSDSTCRVASSLVCNLLESVHHLWKLKMSPEFCVMHLEDRLQEIYFKSRIFIEYIQNHRSPDLSQLCSVLRLDESDLPLLLAISTTHVYSPTRENASSHSNLDAPLSDH